MMPKKSNKFDTSKNDKYVCRLLPFKQEDILSAQEVTQKSGWEITAFNLPAAWQYSQGEGVKIAIIDTGCDLNHSDLKENLLPGKNFVNSRQPPHDDSNHGTHLTGILCAQNNDYGIVGVAPKCKVIPIKALNKDGVGDLRKVAQAIHWAVDEGADFISMSLGSPKKVPVIEQAIQYATQKKVIVFCAAGNAGKTREIFYPAAYPDTIGVGAITEDFNRASFSCTGDDLDFLAPGVKILSTIPDNWYALMSGTSQATPFVVGVCALLLAFVRQHKVDVKLETAADYRAILKNYTTNTQEFAGKKFFQGFGIIDPRKLEEWLRSY
jgi:major intracellular serine protease